ncbi:hypothetical protein C9J60_06490 [Streptomyces sp. A244]|nr:hypothetical protein C9J60_06490 [Streptomyces sp. A244]
MFAAPGKAPWLPDPEVGIGSVGNLPSSARRAGPEGGPGGVWCVQLQGGGGSRRGASVTDDNAADARARPLRAGGRLPTDP